MHSLRMLAAILRPVIVPVYRFLGADPAMFAGTILACDMGGGSLAAQLTADPRAALLGGVINRKGSISLFLILRNNVTNLGDSR